MLLKYTASDHVRKVIAGLGRTEDVKFSPSNCRLAVACLDKNQIAIFDISIADSPHGKQIILTDVAEIFSPYLKDPHGVDFLDEERIIVANRKGNVTIFELQAQGRSNGHQLDPIAVFGADNFVDGPGSVSVISRDQQIYEVIICNNYGDTVTKHVIDLSSGSTLPGAEVRLHKWLRFPDGVSASGKWIAVSNWGLRNVLLYDNVAPLNEYSVPVGILSGIYRPHGVRFTCDGAFLLVADYEGHYVHIYRKDDSGWQGVRSPFKSLRLMSDEAPLRSDGPKGLDIDSSSNTLVTTCKVEPLAFFDFAAIVGDCENQNTSRIEYILNYELERLNEVTLTRSLSWRITAPLRSARSFLTPIWPRR